MGIRFGRAVHTTAILLPFLASHRLPAADCDADGVEDFDQVASGASPDCNWNSIPDACDLVPRSYTFEKAADVLSPIFPVLAADFQRDGRMDLAGVAWDGFRSTSFFVIHRGNGDGTFAEARKVSISHSPGITAVLADLDGDGDVDVAAVDEPGVDFVLLVFPNDGSGALGSAKLSRFPTLWRPYSSVVPMDVDIDGDLDLTLQVGYPFDGNGVRGYSPLLNDGTASFVFGPTTPCGELAGELAGIDLDGDGRTDLAAAEKIGTNFAASIATYLNSGDGSFAPRPPTILSLVYPATNRLTVTDVDGDGRQDLIALGQTGLMAVLFNRGDGALSVPLDFPTPWWGRASAADLDGDRRPELLIASNLNGGVALMDNDGRGILRARAPLSMAKPLQALPVDLDGDGRIDLAVQRGSSPLEPDGINIFLNRPGPWSVDCNGDAVPDECQVASGDLPDCDRNGIPDVCDLAAGTSFDCDRDGVPDECQAADPQVRLDDLQPTFGAGGVVVAGDLDGDGLPDVASPSITGTTLGNGVNVWRNLGGGELAPPIRLPVGSRPITIRLADVDGDGLTEIVTAGYDTMDVLPNRGRGYFGLVRSTATTGTPIGMALGDWDLDGDLDVAVDGFREGTITFLVGDGHGGFVASSPIPTEPNPAALEACDLDGDGRTDLAMVSGTPSVFPAAPAFTWFKNLSEGMVRQPAIPLPVGTTAFALAVLDLDRDGDLDVVTDGDPAVVVRNDGGQFSPPRNIEYGQMLAGYDVDGDGTADLSIDPSTGFPIIWLEGRGERGRAPFFPLARWPTSQQFWPIDFDGDGLADLALEGSVSFNHGDRTFRRPGEIPTSGYAKALRSTDFDGDAHSDLIVAMTLPAGISVFAGRGDGGFDEPRSASVKNSITALAVGDFDGDGDPDLVTAGDLLNLVRNPGRGGPLPAAQTLGTEGGQVSVALGDLDGDGDLDIAYVTETDLATFSQDTRFLENLGDGRFGPVGARVGGDAVDVGAEDLDGDGRTDLAVLRRTSSSITLLLARGRFEFSAATYPLYPFSSVMGQVRFADLDGDGRPDVILPEGEAILSAAGGPGPPVGMSFSRHTVSNLDPADLDGDGLPDLISWSGSGLQLFRNLGAASFEFTGFTRGGWIDGVAAEDWNGDGRMDLALVDDRRTLSVFLNRSPAAHSDCDHNGIPDSCDLAAGAPDCDHDGVLDSCEVASGAPDCNHDGIPDSCDIATGRSIDVRGGGPDGIPDECQEAPYHRGDGNLDGAMDLSDCLCVIHTLLTDSPCQRPVLPGGQLPCAEALDMNGDESIDLSDAVFGLYYLFLSGAEPPPPGPPPGACGIGPRPASDLGCESYLPCRS